MKSSIPGDERPHCLACGSYDVDPQMERYFVIPGYIVTPNCYLLCDEHKGITYDWHDLYEEVDGKVLRKKVDHAAIIARSKKEINNV